MKIGAIILAAGRGSRMQTEIEKQFLPLNGRPLGSWCIRALEPYVDEMVLVATPGEEERTRQLLADEYGCTKIRKTVPGGKERYDSVYAGLCALDDCDLVLIQDSARPCLEKSTILDCIRLAEEKGACVAAVPCKDTIKEAGNENEAIRTPDRRSLRIIQTPQAFRCGLVKRAYDCMMQDENHSDVTDDAMVVERYTGEKVYFAAGTYQNIKVTTPEDLKVAELFLDGILREEKQ